MYEVDEVSNHMYLTLDVDKQIVTTPIDFQIGLVWFNRIVQKSLHIKDYIAVQAVESNKIQLNSHTNIGIIGTFDVFWKLISAHTNIFHHLFGNQDYYVFPQLSSLHIGAVETSIFPDSQKWLDSAISF